MRSSTFLGYRAIRHIENYARELVEQGASLERIYGSLQSRMNSQRS
jgi:hypothetical protein